jgi:diguanylate cyclase (GGDEF)-like protein
METHAQPSISTSQCSPFQTRRMAESWSRYPELTDALIRSLALENRRLNDALDRQSIRDTTSGLFTRRYLEESLERELARARAHQNVLSFILLHIDNFQAFQDACGRPAANILLQSIAHAMNSHIRPWDIGCRYGLEEFAIVMPEAPLYVAYNRAEKLRATIKAFEWCNNSRLSTTTTLTAGIASFPEHATTAPLLVQAAELALSRALKNGTDRVELPAQSLPALS